MSLRLETTWFGAQDTNGVDNNAYNDASQHGFAPGSTAQSSPSGKGMGESGNGEGGWGGADGVQRGPAQWDEEKTVDFFQVSRARIALFSARKKRLGSWLVFSSEVRPTR